MSANAQAIFDEADNAEDHDEETLISLAHDDFLVLERVPADSAPLDMAELLEKAARSRGADAGAMEEGQAGQDATRVDSVVEGGRGRASDTVRRGGGAGGRGIAKSGAEGELERMTVVQLKEMCKELRVPVSGRKAELIQRIHDRRSR